MKVILLKDIPKVGARYAVKEFADGYAQNVLINKGLAIRATPAELTKLEDRNKKLKSKQDADKKTFISFIEKANGMTIRICAKANEKGSLFSAVNKKDILSALETATGMDIKEHAIEVGHIKELGAHKITIQSGENKGIVTILIEKA